MPSLLLSRARAYEAEHLPQALASEQPRFHLTAGAGWLNDPNGFSFYQGACHLFYQYNPYSTRWDTMHWGHVRSRDFIRWERLPCALAPDRDYDRNGCYSGSALELPDGRHLLMYTGVRRKEDGTEVQTQCIALGDGVDYEKYEGNPVIPSELLPPGASTAHFRDPKLWEAEGRYQAVLGNLGPDGSGTVLRYESEDALHWRFAGQVAASGNRLGEMWECPDLFRLDGWDVLLVSPQGMTGKGPEFLDGNTTLCLIGALDENGRLAARSEHTVDYGLDFYAIQTVLTPDGRRVLIAWMQYWGGIPNHPREDLPFFGQMTLPRELHVREGRLVQTPVRELEAYRGDRVLYRDLDIQGETSLPGVRGRCLDLTVSLRPGDGGFRSFTAALAAGTGEEITVRYEPETNAVTVDRSRTGWSSEVLNRRTFGVRDRGGAVKLRFLLDRYSLELFVNDGEQAASFVIFSSQEADGIRFTAEGSVLADLEQYTLQLD